MGWDGLGGKWAHVPLGLLLLLNLFCCSGFPFFPEGVHLCVVCLSVVVTHFLEDSPSTTAHTRLRSTPTTTTVSFPYPPYKASLREREAPPSPPPLSISYRPGYAKE